MSKKFSWAILSIFVALAMILASCGGGAQPTQAPAAQPTQPPAAAAPTTAPVAAPTTAPEPTTAPVATEAPTTAPVVTEAAAPTTAPAATEAGTAAPSSATAGGQELADAMAGKYKGTKVTAMGPFVDADEVAFKATMKDFMDKTGIEIQYEGTKEFETVISTRVDGGNPPDIADFPQPGLAKNFAKGGKLMDVSKFLDMNYVKSNYNQSWLDMAMMAGKDGTPFMAGVWERVNGKSNVFYPKKAFEAAGYKIPTTWDELTALENQIISDGDTPWCIGIESGTATGWPVTDWMEDVMLRTTSPENYDKWVAGELKFSSPEVKNAADIVGKIFLDPKMVYGGPKTIVTTSFMKAADPMFQDPPKCWLHKQGNFITSFFPKEAKMGVDYDMFYLPPIDPQYGKPFLVAGDIWGVFNDRPEVRAVMQYFTKGEHLKAWMANGGAIAPQKDADLAWYGSDVERAVAKNMLAATTLRFDASDLMPGQVGSGSFWKAMTDWISGNIDEATALKEIDDSWPK